MTTPPLPRALEPGLVGREAALAALARAAGAVERGRPAAVIVTGVRGVGKSAVMSAFAARLRSSGALVMEGRCRAPLRPHAGIDAWAAQLAAALSALPSPELNHVLPEQIDAAAQMLPGLRHVPAIAARCRQPGATHAPAARRRAGWAALSALVGRLAERRLLAFLLDDLHLAGEDVIRLLAGALWPERQVAPVLFVGAGRRPLPELAAPHVDVMPLGPLDEPASRALCGVLLGDRATAAPGRISRASGGVPRAAVQLCSAVAEPVDAGAVAGAARSALAPETLVGVIVRDRFEALPATTRRMVAALAAAEAPLPEAVAARVAGAGADAAAAVAALCAGGWARRLRVRDRDALDISDDDTRAAIRGALPPAELAELSRLCAEQLALYGEADAAAVAAAYAAAGDRSRAAEHALVAARAAREALAFACAAHHYEVALSGAPQRQQRAHLAAELAEVLSADGRREEAAARYAEAAAALPAEEARLLSHAGIERVLAGDLDGGWEAAAALWRTAGARLPALARRRERRLSTRRAALAWRGRRFGAEAGKPPQPPPQRPAGRERGRRDGERADLCWVAAASFGRIDPLLAMPFHARQLSRALRAGDPRRVARGLALEAALSAGEGEAGRERAAQMIARATALARAAHDSYVLAFVEVAGASGELARGGWSAALDHLHHAGALLGGRGALFGFEPVAIGGAELVALFNLGELAELDIRQRELDAVAGGDGDVAGAIALRTGHACAAHLVRGQPGVAESAAAWARELAEARGLDISYLDLWARAHIELYRGDGDQAWQRISASFGALAGSPLFRLQQLRIELLWLRARAALAAAAAGESADASALTHEAARAARRLGRIANPWTSALVQLVRAGAFAVRGDLDRASTWLRAAEASFDRAGMAMHAAAARRRRGVLVGGKRGEALVRAADDALRAQGAVEPERIAAMLAPGFE